MNPLSLKFDEAAPSAARQQKKPVLPRPSGLICRQLSPLSNLAAQTRCLEAIKIKVLAHSSCRLQKRQPWQVAVAAALMFLNCSDQPVHALTVPLNRHHAEEAFCSQPAGPGGRPGRVPVEPTRLTAGGSRQQGVRRHSARGADVEALSYL